jgi:hypothetical protein
MQAFFEWTAWEMEKPAAYGWFHILMTAGLLALSVWGAYALRRTTTRQNRIVLGVVGGFLLVSEVYKIGFHMTANPYGWYFWGAFPFQLCSLPMYLCLFCALCRKESINRWLYEAMFAVNMVGGIMAFVEPSGIQHGYWSLTLHAYVWHMLLIFLGLYLYFSKRACTDKASYGKAAVVYLVACGVAQGCNLIFGDKINCFYISPYVRSPLAVFKNIYAACGWIVNMLLLMLAVLLASAVIYYVGYVLRLRKKVTV